VGFLLVRSVFRGRVVNLTVVGNGDWTRIRCACGAGIRGLLGWSVCGVGVSGPLVGGRHMMLLCWRISGAGSRAGYCEFFKLRRWRKGSIWKKSWELGGGFGRVPCPEYLVVVSLSKRLLVVEIFGRRAVLESVEGVEVHILGFETRGGFCDSAVKVRCIAWCGKLWWWGGRTGSRCR